MGILTLIPIITEDLLPGDLLFQLRIGGEAEWAISRIFAGRDGYAINHVAIYTGDDSIIEAVMPHVQKITLSRFIDSSVKDNHDRPCVLVCRLLPDHSPLIPAALMFAEQQVEVPYDSRYQKDPNCTNRSWYCSELVIHAFRQTSNSHFLFEETPMSFRDMDTGDFIPYWIEHYEKNGQKVPEGESGSHPALLSQSDNLIIVKVIGALPAKNDASCIQVRS
ncbi:MAG: YiiX/YebB-like N1pC/P60 family cysteine hydrolase [Endozoicomonas sp.]